MGENGRRIRLRPGGRKKVISIVATVGIVASLCAGVVRSTTTIAPTYPGNVVRDSVITLTINPVARMFSRSTATSNWAVTSPLVAGNGFPPLTSENGACRGDNGPFGSTSGLGTNIPRNNSPRTGLNVTGPGGVVAFDGVSPAINTTLAGATTPASAGGPYPVLNPQPTGPSDTSYRGGSPSASPNNLTQTRPWVVTVDMTGKPAGFYTVTTTTRNMLKSTSAGLCTIGTAVPGTTTSTLGMQVDTQQFEYRPWQHVFKDIFGGGKVNMNVAPKEFQVAVANQTGAIHPADQTMSQYQLPNLEANFMLPSDPAGCANDPNSCLPAGSVECTPDAAGCEPDIAIINKEPPGDRLQGVFDLNAHAFIALANVNGYQRILLSLGTKQDAVYRSLLNQLAAQASANGVDLMHILGTTVRVRLGENEITLSLLNGLQIQPKAAGAADGIQIVSDFTVQAGLILNIYASLGGPVCTATSGDSNPATAAPDRYAHSSDAGYTVEKSDLLPDVPRVGPVGALVGGPIYHIEGDFVGAAPALVNTSTAIIGVDTAADEPNGYPIWVEPFLSSPAHVTTARTMDFIGTATWSASETPITGVGCLTVDFMLGAGVALYNNPLDVGFGDIPIWDPQSPAVAALIDQIDVAVQGVVDQVAGDPTVNELLNTILDTVTGTPLPPLPA